MTDYSVGYYTDIGTRKSVNQDSLCVKKGIINEKLVVLAIICDGMGGHEKGELASATMIRAFSEWFKRDLPSTELNLELIENQWNMLIQSCNRKLWEYGNKNSCQVGTTLTALLLIGEIDYLIAQVGDSRAYGLANSIVQMTEDQSYIAREVKKGTITKEEAEKDARRNVLLQCIGVTSSVEPDYYRGKIIPNSAFLLCSDGFCRKTNQAEFYQCLYGLSNKKEIENKLSQITAWNMQRGETDNITAIYIQQVNNSMQS